jgi:outer membrane protein assembly factor BamB
MKALATLLVLVSGLAAAEPPSLPNLPKGVTSFGAAFHDDAVYLFGGHLGRPHNYSWDMVQKPLLKLSFAEDAQWEELPTEEPALGPALIPYKGGLIRIGGMQPRNAAAEDEDMWSVPFVRMFDTKTQRWTKLPDLPDPRSSHDAFIDGDTIYVAGGWNMRGPESSLWHATVLKMDLSADEPAWETIRAPFYRRAIAVGIAHGNLYVMGGLDKAAETSGRVDVLNLATGKWSMGPELPDSPVKGFGLSAMSAGGELYTTGLNGGVHRLDTKTNQWVEVARLEKPRMFPRLIAADDETLIVIGGGDRKGHISEIEVISVKEEPSKDEAATSASTWSPDWPADGPKVAWKKGIGTGMTSFAFHEGLAIAVGNTEETDHIIAMDLASGEEKWQVSNPTPVSAHEHSIVPGGPASTPVVAGDRVFVLGRHGLLQAIEVNSGTVIWKTDLVEDHGAEKPVYGYACAPLVHDGTLYVDAGGEGVSTIAFEAATGKVQWKAGDRGAGYSHLQIHARDGHFGLVAFKADALIGMSLDDGSEEWAIPWETRDGCNTAVPVLMNTEAIISSSSGGIARYVVTQGDEPTWQDRDTGLLFNSAVVFQDKLYGFNDSRRDADEFFCINPATGESEWVSKECSKGSFVLEEDGRLLTFSREGELTAARITAEGLEVVSRTQALGGKCYPQVATHNGFILCRNNDGETVCFDAGA